MAAYTWTGAISSDYGNAGNWSGFPVAIPAFGDTITFSGSVNCNLGSNRIVQGLTFSGYTGTLQLTGNLTVNGNVTFQSTAMNVSGTNTLIIGANSTLTANGGNWLGKLQLGNAGTITVTLPTGFSVAGTLSFSGTVSLSGAVNITALGDIDAQASCIVSTNIISITTLVIGGASSQWSGQGRIGCNVNFLSAGNLALVGNVFFGSVVSGSATPTMTFTNATSFVTTGSTLGIVGNCTLAMQNANLNNVNLLTLGANSNYTISLTENLNIFGNLATATDGNGSHTISRTGSQTINLRGNLSIGTSAFLGSLNASLSSGAKIVMLGNASTTSTISGSRIAFSNATQANWCNIDLEIASGANTVALSTTNEFNFGNTGTINPVTYRTLKYTSGNFVATGSIINLANSILDLGARTLNNVRIYPSGTANTSYSIQLVTDLTITGNLSTGTATNNAGGGQIISGGVATNLNIQGGLSVGTNSTNFLVGAINLRMIGTGSLVGVAFCRNNIFFAGVTYTIGNFLYGNILPAGAVSEMTKISGTVTASGTLIIAGVKFDIGTTALDNVSVSIANADLKYNLIIKSSTVLRVNGNFVTGINLTGGTQYGGVNITNDPSNLNTQLDIYGNLTIGSGINPNYQGIVGTSKIYMKGTGTISTGSPFALFNFCGIDLFIDGVNITLSGIILTNSKKIEYVSGIFNTANSLTTIYLNGTIKSLGQTWGDIGIRGSSVLVVDGNLTCRDLITYSADSGNTGIQGAGFNLTIKRNLTNLNNGVLLGGNLSSVNPIDKLIMNATDVSNTGTWTSGTGGLRISLDLNAPSRTIVVQNQVVFGNNVLQRLRWFSGTTMTTTGSTLLTAGCTLDLGNQVWGGLTTGANASVHFESDATFTNVNLTGGSTTYLNGISAARNLTVQINLSVSQPTGTFTGFQLVNIRFDGSGTWTNAAIGYLNENVTLVSGTRTLLGTVVWGNNSLGIGGNKTFNATGGILQGGTSTFVVSNSNTITVDKTTRGSFNNVNLSPNATITLNAQMGIAGTLLLSSTASSTTIFDSSSTFGWDAVNFTHGGGNTTCILNAGSTYNVSGTFQLLGSNDTTRATLRSSQLTSFTGTANGTTLTLAAPSSGSPIVPNMVISQATGVAQNTLAALLPNRPSIQSGSGLSWVLNPTYPVTPAQGPIPMESGLKAFFNLAPVTGVALVLFAITKDIDSNGGQTVYAFQSYTDAPSNPQANLFRTLNWNTLAPPVAPIGIGYLSVT